MNCIYLLSTRIKQSLLILLLLIILIVPVFGQEIDDLFAELDSISPVQSVETIATFKSTRVMLGPSTERVKKGQLHFRISHLFSELSSGGKNLFGIDDLTNMHMSFEYGWNDKIQLGFARTNKPDKTLQGSAKFSLLRQRTGKKSFPVSVSYFANIDLKTVTYFPKERNKYFKGRLDYINMLLISRKINKKLSIQISPSYLHRNLTDFISEPNDIFSIGIGGRYMLNEHISVNPEYFYTLPTADAIAVNQNQFTIGIDVETGGHVFQIFLTNANALHPGKFLLNQNKDFFKGDIQLGFSMSREFNLIKRKKPTEND